MFIPTFSEADIEQQFRDFMAKHDASPAPYETLILDGKLHRYDIDGEKKYRQSGAYVIHTDNIPAGFLQNWKTGLKTFWTFRTDSLSQEQRDYFNSPEVKARAEELRKQREKELADTQAKAADYSRSLWTLLKEEQGNHPYLVKKHIYPYGIRTDGDRIAIPLRNFNGDIQSLQWISPDGVKRFQLNTSPKGLFWAIGLDVITHEQSATILIGEGFATMAKVYELTGLSAVAAMSCYNLQLIAEILHQQFPNANIICTADNDIQTQANRGFNPGHEAAINLKSKGLICDFICPDFSNGQNGSDWNDYASIHGDENTAHVLDEAIRNALIPQHIRDIITRTTIFNAQDLRNMTFPPIKWAVDGFLPDGLSILAGGPKIGKSILALHLAVGVAVGGCVLGKINVAKGQVLYLALEDTPRRLQERINYGEFTGEISTSLHNLDIITEIPRQNMGGIDYLDWWLDTHNLARLVIIDTFQMFRKLLTGKGSMYSEDYEAVSSIKKLADNYHVATLLLHHLKKGMEGDWLSEISGSQGIAGAADTIFSLKRERNSNLATLHRTGRDVEERDFIMKLDGYGWTLQDDAEAFTMPEWKRQIMDFLKVHGTVTPIQLSEAVNIPLNTAQQHLRRLAKEGSVKKTGYGTYGLPEE